MNFSFSEIIYLLLSNRGILTGEVGVKHPHFDQL